MTDLLHVLPDFSPRPFLHLLPSLDRNQITVSDLLTLDAADVARRAKVPAPEVRRLADAILTVLHRQLGVNEGSDDNQSEAQAGASLYNNGPELFSRLSFVSTLDDGLDNALGGGVPSGYIVEITGESGAGKTQFLLTLLLAAQLPPPRGISKPALYISTEAPLATNRLSQLLSTHPRLANLPDEEKPTLSRVLSIQTPDLESQDHIIRYQLPVAIARHNVGLVIIDSIAANYRAEFERPGSRSNGASMAKRRAELVKLGAFLRELARIHNIAIVVANQVADRLSQERVTTTTASRATSYNSMRTEPFEPASSNGNDCSRVTNTPTAPAPQPLTSADPLALDHQQRWFTGWGDLPDMPSTSLKTPSLGLVWTNQIACRIALLKEAVYKAPLEGGSYEERELMHWKRYMRVVFAPWVGPSHDKGVELEIVKAGIRSVKPPR